jgi:hypothetical protein
MDRGLVVSATIAAIPRTALAIVKVQLSRVAIARCPGPLDPSVRAQRKTDPGSQP